MLNVMSKNLISSLAVVAFGVTVLIVSAVLPQGEAAKDLIYAGSGLASLGTFFAFCALFAG